MLDDPAVQLVEAAALPLGSGLQRAAEHLATGPLGRHHQPAGQLHRRVTVQITLDEGESQIDAGGHARGGPDALVLEEDRSGIDLDRGVEALELLALLPVGHGPTPVQERPPRGRRPRCRCSRARRPWDRARPPSAAGRHRPRPPALPGPPGTSKRSDGPSRSRLSPVVGSETPASVSIGPPARETVWTRKGAAPSGPRASRKTWSSPATSGRRTSG